MLLTGSTEALETPHTVSLWPGSMLYCLMEFSPNPLSPYPSLRHRPLHSSPLTHTHTHIHPESVHVGPLHRNRPLGPVFSPGHVAPDYRGCSGPVCLLPPCWGAELWLSAVKQTIHTLHQRQQLARIGPAEDKEPGEQLERVAQDCGLRWIPTWFLDWQDLPPLCWVPIPEGPFPQGFQLCHGDSRTVHQLF